MISLTGIVHLFEGQTEKVAFVLTPDLGVCVRDRLTSVDVQDLELKVKAHAGLSVGHILANVLSGDVVRALSDLGAEHTGGVAGEEGLLGGVESVVLGGQVRGVQSREITDCCFQGVSYEV